MRRIVPDASVMVAAFFPEWRIIGGVPCDISARAMPLANAIRTASVRAFAPDTLIAEFLKVACAKAYDRSGASTVDPHVAQAQTLDFMALPLTPIPAGQLAAVALDLAMTSRVSPPDAWFLAAALYADAELWYTHRHHDGVVE